MTDRAETLRNLVETTLPRLRSVPDEATREALAPGKWSRRQILGHLIDSAANNHHRLVRGLTGEAVVPGYAQDDWVRVQGYDLVHWSELIEFWRVYNLHIAHVFERVPVEMRSRWILSDYIGHMKHHLRQILGEIAES